MDHNVAPEVSPAAAGRAIDGRKVQRWNIGPLADATLRRVTALQAVQEKMSDGNW